MELVSTNMTFFECHASTSREVGHITVQQKTNIWEATLCVKERLAEL